MDYNNLEIDKIKYARVGYYNPDWESWEEIDDDDLRVYHEFHRPDEAAFIFLYETENGYVNIFNPEEKCNVFKWNVTGESTYPFGMNVYFEWQCVQGEPDGKCYLLDDNKKLFIKGYEENTISLEMLTKFMIKTRNMFFVNRWEAVFNGEHINIVDKIKTVSTDFARRKKYQRFCEEKEAERK